MQFRGHSLPVRQSMRVSWDFFSLSYFVSQFPPTLFPLLTAIGMCHFLPVHHLEWHFEPSQRSKHNNKIYPYTLNIYNIFFSGYVWKINFFKNVHMYEYLFYPTVYIYYHHGIWEFRETLEIHRIRTGHDSMIGHGLHILVSPLLTKPYYDGQAAECSALYNIYMLNLTLLVKSLGVP